MQLADYLREQNLSQAAFGERIGEPQQTVSRIAAGRSIPRPKIMAKIVEATGGAVTPNDFYKIEQPDEAA